MQLRLEVEHVPRLMASHFDGKYTIEYISVCCQ